MERIARQIAGASGPDPFAAAVRATRMPIVISDPRQPDNPVVFANDAFCRLTGYARREIVGRNCRFLQGSGTDPAAARRVGEAVRAGEPIETDLLNYRKDGTAFWNRMLMMPVPDAQGKPVFFIASQVDVTLEHERVAGLESHNAALLAALGDRLRALSESEARLLMATQAARLGIWELDPATGMLTASPIARQHFGGDPAPPATGAALLARIDPEDRGRVAAAMAGQAAGMVTLECRILRPDGDVLWLQLRMEMLRGGDGAPLRLAGVSLDLTERRQAEQRLARSEEALRLASAREEAALRAANATLERQVVERTEALRASEQRMRAVFQTSYQLKALLAPDGTILDVNATALAAIGYPLDDVAACVFWDSPFFDQTPGMRAGMREAVARAVLGQETRQLVTLQMQAGPRGYDFSVRPIQDAQGTTMAVLAEAIDITDRRQAEERLRQAQKMEAVGQLTGGIAHDFNNLLTGIVGSLELLQRRVAEGRTEGLGRYAAAASAAAQRAAALTQRLLAFARRQPLDPKAVDANRLLSGMAGELRQALGPGIALDLALKADLWPALCDPTQLQNAIQTLAANARDAMPEGGMLSIETANADISLTRARQLGGDMRPGAYVAICIGDTGTGMTQDVIAKAFDPFFTTKPLGQGTGLGLSMLYGFVKQSNGHVKVVSTPGHGSLFSLYLPRQETADPAEAGLPAEDAGQALPPRAAIVLVVEDEATVRELVTETLREAGYQALEAADGPAGLAILQSGARVDLLVTDVGLPGLNGRQLADAARLARPGLRVLFMTGYTHNAAIGQGEALEPGMEIIAKPFRMDGLTGRVAQMIGGLPGSIAP